MQGCDYQKEETSMGSNKVQGEGDYESARRYRKATEESAREHAKRGEPSKDDARKASDKLTPEERAGRSRAKAPGQDKRDAAYMDDLVEKKNKR
jgi:hypothetical protein